MVDILNQRSVDFRGREGLVGREGEVIGLLMLRGRTEGRCIQRTVLSVYPTQDKAQGF